MMRSHVTRKITIGFSVCLAVALAAFAAAGLFAGSSAMNPKSPVTLAALMDKLETLQSQMQENARATEAMRAALEQQRGLNARLLSLLAASSTSTSAVLSPNPPAPPPPQIKPKLTFEICGKLGQAYETKLAFKASGEGDIKGFIGADVFGNGALADIEVKGGAEVGVEAGPESGLEASACLTGFEFDLDGVVAQNIFNTLTQHTTTLGNEVGAAYLNAPGMHGGNLGKPLAALQNLQVNVGSGQILSGLKQPANFFQQFQGLTNTLPFPGNTGSLIQNPTSLFPTINDFDVNNLCGGTQAGTLFDDLCVRAQSFTSPLVPISNVLTNVDNVLGNVDTKVDNFINGLNGVTSNVTTLINDVGSLQVGVNQLNGQVSNLETGVTNLCNGLNSRITTIRNGVVSFPARNYSLDLGPVGTFSIPVDILRNDQPYSGLSSVGCPTF